MGMKPTVDTDSSSDDANFALHGWSLVWTTIAMTVVVIVFVTAFVIYYYRFRITVAKYSGYTSATADNSFMGISDSPVLQNGYIASTNV